MSKLYEALRNSSVSLRRESHSAPTIRLGKLTHYEYALSQSELRTVENAVDKVFVKQRGECIGFTTSHGGNGAAVIARDYAFSKAAAGLRTLLIDADYDAMPLRWHFFGDQKVRTLASIGADNWQESVCDELTSRLDFMIAGQSTVRLEGKQTPRIDGNLVREIRRGYDLSVFLLGSLTLDSELIRLTHYLDGVFIVTDNVDDSNLNDIGESLKASGVPIMGAVVYG